MLAQLVNGSAIGGVVRGRSFVHNSALALVWLTLATSGFVFTEPCPTDALTMVLIVGLPVIGLVRTGPLLGLLLIMVGALAATGLIAATFADDTQKAVMHTVVSLFLGGGAFVLAGFVAQNPERHLSLIFSGLTVASIIAAATGIAGYFDVFPGAEIFTKFARASGTFKDPNVFGPFLVPALLYALKTALDRPLAKSIGPLALAGFLALAVFLSFSRGAWVNLIVALGVYLFLAFLTCESNGRRQKIVLLALLGAFTISGVIAAAIQTDKVAGLLSERASVSQSYDVGPEGRFGGQEKAIALVLENPLGIGAGTFALAYHHEEPHNVYLSMPLNAGWMGAGIYVLLVAATILLGLRECFKRSPWQPLVLIAFAAFVANAAEGLIIDSDHWRHFYLLLAIIWGMAAAPRPALTKVRAAKHVTRAAAA